MEFKDYYATLGVAKTATEKDIKQAYRKLARKFHPDVNPGDKTAESRFKAINEAYEVLGDPDKRRKYDELGANWRQYEQALHPGEVDAGLVDEVLDEAQPVDLAPRVDPDAPDRAGGLDEAEALVLPQRLRVHAQLPRRHADEEQLVVLSHTVAIQDMR